MRLALDALMRITFDAMYVILISVERKSHPSQDEGHALRNVLTPSGRVHSNCCWDPNNVKFYAAQTEGVIADVLLQEE